MVYMYFLDTSREEAEKLSGLKYMEYPDSMFRFLTRNINLNSDENFRKYLLEIDNADIPMDNVVRDICTGMTHSFDYISTSVKMMWLMEHYSGKALFPSCYFGQNCYQIVFDIGKEHDIHIYDDSAMFACEESFGLVGEFTDAIRETVVKMSGDAEAFEYYEEFVEF